MWWTALELPPDPPGLAVPLGQALPQCSPGEGSQCLENAAPGAVISLVQCSTCDCSTDHKGAQQKANRSKTAAGIGHSCSLGLVAKKSSSWSGKGDQVGKQSRVCSYEIHGRETKGRTPSKDKRFMSSAQAAKPLPWLPQKGQCSMYRADVSSYQYLGNSTLAHNNCSKRQLVIEQAALSVLHFELNKFHNGNYHVTVQPKNLSMSAKGSAVDWWQSVCPWNRPNSEQFDKESSKYHGYFCIRRRE